MISVISRMLQGVSRTLGRKNVRTFQGRYRVFQVVVEAFQEITGGFMGLFILFLFVNFNLIASSERNKSPWNLNDMDLLDSSAERILGVLQDIPGFSSALTDFARLHGAFQEVSDGIKGIPTISRGVPSFRKLQGHSRRFEGRYRMFSMVLEGSSGLQGVPGGSWGIPRVLQGRTRRDPWGFRGLQRLSWDFRGVTGCFRL